MSSIYALVIASNLCWARQAGKKCKRLLMIYRTKSETLDTIENELADLDELLACYSSLDEQHVLRREYTLLLKCNKYAEAKNFMIKMDGEAKGEGGEFEAKEIKIHDDRIQRGLRAINNDTPIRHKATSSSYANKSETLSFGELLRVIRAVSIVLPSDNRYGITRRMEMERENCYCRIVLLGETDVTGLIMMLKDHTICLSNETAPRIVGGVKKKRDESPKALKSVTEDEAKLSVDIKNSYSVAKLCSVLQQHLTENLESIPNKASQFKNITKKPRHDESKRRDENDKDSRL